MKNYAVTMSTQTKIIKDIRQGFGGQITIERNRPYYAGTPITDLLKDTIDGRQNHNYTIVQGSFNAGSICLKDEDFQEIHDLLNPIEFTRVKSDVNGNPRFVCHFLSFISSNEEGSIDEKYSRALSRARNFGGRKFHNKQYGGGIVFQMYDGQIPEMSRKIREYVKSLNA